MAITPTTPITLPAVVLDSYWMSRLSMNAPEIAAANALPKKDADAIIQLIPYASSNLQEVPEKAVLVPIKGIFAKIAAGDTDLAKIVELILAYAEKEAKAQKLI